MKKAIIAVVFLTGCASNPYSRLTDKVVDNGLSKFEDKKGDVNCYVYRDSDGSSISCVKAGQ